MTRRPEDDLRGSQPRDDSGTDHDALARLEQALADEVNVSAGLRESLDRLRTKVEQIEASFVQRLEDAERRGASAESKLADQRKRLEALGNGREESMRLLAEARTALAHVSAERDQLREQLARVDGMQSATIALGEEEAAEPNIHYSLPSIEELMASLSSIEEAGSRHDSGHLLAAVARDDDESQEMIAPEIVFPEEYGKKDGKQATEHPRVSRVLVLLDGDQPIKYPLYKATMTIGRSEQADIHVTGDFISRIHARLVVTDTGVTVEDLDSKNGIHVNSEPALRRQLRHGDVLALGKVRFTFIDTSAHAAD